MIFYSRTCMLCTNRSFPFIFIDNFRFGNIKMFFASYEYCFLLAVQTLNNSNQIPFLWICQTIENCLTLLEYY